jgi:type IV fimbrial biogenesis protein FimT
MKNKTSQRGFTLIEMAITTTIASVLAAAAIPSFSDYLGRQRLSMTVNEIQAALALARSEAMGQGGRVAVTPSSSSGWAGGWQVFHDSNDNGTLDDGERVVQQFGPVPQGISIATHGPGLATAVSYTPAGLARRAGTDGFILGRMVVTYGSTRREGANHRTICFSTARTRVANGATCS